MKSPACGHTGGLPWAEAIIGKCLLIYNPTNQLP